MTERRYEPLKPITRQQAVELLESTDPDEVCETLFRIAWFDSDWQWVRNTCLDLLSSKEDVVRYAAATSLSNLARVHPDPTWLQHVGRLRAHLEDPADSVVAGVEGALEFIERFSRSP